MTKTDKVPRLGTATRRLYDALRGRDLCFTDAMRVYSDARVKLGHQAPSWTHLGITIRKLLKRFGHKTGKPGSRAPWTFGPAPVRKNVTTLSDAPELRAGLLEELQRLPTKTFKVGDRVRYTDPKSWTSREGCVGTVDDRLTSQSSLWGLNYSDSYYGVPEGGGWPVTWEDKNLAFGWIVAGWPAEGRFLERLVERKLEMPDLEGGPVDADLEEPVPDFSLPEGALVRYSGPNTQDVGMVGRIEERSRDEKTCQVRWLNTGELAQECLVHLALVKETTVAPPRDGGSYLIAHPFRDGDAVTYVGPDPMMRGNGGKVLTLVGKRVQVNWGPVTGVSCEDPASLQLERLVERKLEMPDLEGGPVGVVDQGTTFPTPGTFGYLPFKIGDFVECEKHGLRFPAKVFFGPTSEDKYKLVCPNGTYEWAHRSKMRPVAVPYQATVQKPGYEGAAPESDETTLARSALEGARRGLEAAKKFVEEAQLALEESVARDRRLHWARVALRGMTEAERGSLLEVLQVEGTGKPALVR